jgi:hypothetical protein
MTIDQHSDPGFKRLRQLVKQYPQVYPHVKTASFDHDERTWPSTAFAWPAERKYPINSEKQAALSYLYAKDDPKVPIEVKNSIKEALLIYEIPLTIFEQQEEKVAALKPEDCLFSESQTYPIRNEAEIKYAEQRLLKQLTRLTPETRAKAFVRLNEKAAALNVQLQPISLRYAGQTETDVQYLADAIRARSGAAKEAQFQEVYNKLADLVVQRPDLVHDRNARIKLASALNELDQKANLLHLYDKKIADPIATVFNTEKTAEPMINLGGKYAKQSTLLSLSPKFYGDYFGDDILPEITNSGGSLDAQKLAQVLDTLPNDLKRSFARQLGL